MFTFIALFHNSIIPYKVEFVKMRKINKEVKIPCILCKYTILFVLDDQSADEATEVVYISLWSTINHYLSLEWVRKRSLKENKLCETESATMKTLIAVKTATALDVDRLPLFLRGSSESLTLVIPALTSRLLRSWSAKA